MAQRVQKLCDVIDTTYGGDATRIWTEAADGEDLVKRIVALPGFGKPKAASVVAVIGKHFGIKPPGWERVAPQHPTLGDVATADELARYQTQKRAHKAELRAAARQGQDRE
jgi:uncharacterized HhH-GPD family protein